MVYGIEKFKEAFRGFQDSYVIIGGTACDIALKDSQMRARATEDIDMVIVVERLSPAFVDSFWAFIAEGGYKIGKRKRGEDKEPAYVLYRFSNPKSGYPLQIELLSRHDSALGDPSGFHIEPLPTAEEQYSLSAIMLDEDYYNLTVQNSEIVDGLRIASPVALIGLKEKAFLNLKTDREKGLKINTKDITKHRNDVLKLAAVVAPGPYPSGENVLNTNKAFVDYIRSSLPGQALKDALGINDVELADLIDVLDGLFAK